MIGDSATRFSAFGVSAAPASSGGALPKNQVISVVVVSDLLVVGELVRVGQP